MRKYLLPLLVVGLILSGTDYLFSQQSGGPGVATSVSAAAFPLLAPNGTGAAPSYAFSTCAGCGMFTDGANTIFSRVGVSRWQIDGNNAWAPIPDNTEDVGGSSTRIRDVWVGRSIQAGTGPHGFGTSIDSRAIVTFGGTQSGSASESYAVLYSGNTNPVANNNSFMQRFSGGSITKAGSGTHPDFANVQIEAPGIIGGAAAVTNASTLLIQGAPTGATNNFAVLVKAGTSQFGGSVLSTSATGGVGYATGAGGAVTQATSRTTGVTLNKTTGQITMFSAAGSATAATFTVTNSAVAATDTIILNQNSGTNLYELFVTSVSAGSFNVTFFTTGGTATDAPVINFTVLKGVAA